MDRVVALAQDCKDYCIEIRRQIHMRPEASLCEFETCKLIQRELEKIGLPYRTVRDIGVIADVEGAKPGRRIALRSDHDALEIEEQTGLPFASKNPGLMHACGHDMHTAMLLGAARILNGMRDELKGSVRLIFQPAEELLAGSPVMIEAGCLDGVDEIFGIHSAGGLEVGGIDIAPGHRMASSDGLRIRIKGTAAHGARPETGVDAVVAGAALTMNLQSIVSREITAIEPAVVTVGQFHGGTRSNIVAGEAYLDLTVRCFSPDVRAHIMSSIRRIALATCETYRASCEFETLYATSSCYNHPGPTERARRVAADLFGVESLSDQPARMGSEDFAYYVERIPGAFAFIGTRNTAKGIVHASHNGRFDVDEDAIPLGVALHVGYALDFLSE